MAERTLSAPVELPPPIRLNTDASPSQLTEEESPELLNVITRERGQIRVRRGQQARVQWNNSAGGVRMPVGVARNGETRILIGSVDSFATGYASAAQFFDNGAATPYSLAGYSYRGLPPSEFCTIVDGTTTGTYTVTSGDENAGSGDVWPLFQSTIGGRWVEYDKVTFWPSYKSIGGVRKDGGASRAGTIIQAWSGANGAAKTTRTTTAGTSLSNGSDTVTLSAADAAIFAASKTGQFLINASSPGVSAPRYMFPYKIKSHTGGATTMVLERKYGRGESTTNIPNLAVGNDLYTAPYFALYGGPCDASSIEIFRDRMFAGKGYILPATGAYFGSYANVIQWSTVGNPYLWPDTNFIILDEDYQNPVTGMISMGDHLIIARWDRLMRLDGYDESSFVPSTLARGVGAMSSWSMSMTKYGAVIADQYNCFLWDGDKLSNLTNPDGTGMIQKLWQSLTGGASWTYDTVVQVEGFEDYLYVSFYTYGTGASTMLVYHFPTQAWSKFSLDPTVSAAHNPAFLIKFNRRMHAVTCGTGGTTGGVFELTDCYHDENTAASVTSMCFDQYYTNTSGTIGTKFINATVQWRDIRMAAGSTARLSGVRVEHNVHYYGASSDSANQKGWVATLDADADIDSTTLAVGDVAPRYVGNTGALKPEKYFTTTFNNVNYPTEGSVFRFALSNVGTVSTNRAYSMKVFRVVMDVMGTKYGRVDNPTL